MMGINIFCVNLVVTTDYAILGIEVSVSRKGGDVEINL